MSDELITELAINPLIKPAGSPVEETQPEEVVDEKICMTDKELAEVNANTEKFKLYEAKQKIIDVQMQSISLRKQFLESQLIVVERDHTILKLYALKDSAEFKEFRENSKQMMSDIAKVHDLDGKKFSYDPESGEIIADE